MGLNMDLKFLVTGIDGYSLAIPLQEVIATELIEPKEIEYHTDYLGTVQFQGGRIPYIDLGFKISGKKSPRCILVALLHTFSSLGIGVDSLIGIHDLNPLFPLPEIIKKASGGLLDRLAFLKDKYIFTINIDPLISMEELRTIEAGVLS